MVIITWISQFFTKNNLFSYWIQYFFYNKNLTWYSLIVFMWIFPLQSTELIKSLNFGSNLKKKNAKKYLQFFIFFVFIRYELYIQNILLHFKCIPIQKIMILYMVYRYNGERTDENAWIIGTYAHTLTQENFYVIDEFGHILKYFSKISLMNDSK